MTTKLHVLRTPFARHMLAMAAAMQVDPRVLEAMRQAEAKQARRRQLEAAGMTEEEYAAYCAERGGPLKAEELNSVLEKQAQPPRELPKTQRLRMIDDDGLRYLNAAKAKRRAINAKRAENQRRADAGRNR